MWSTNESAPRLWAHYGPFAPIVQSPVGCCQRAFPTLVEAQRRLDGRLEGSCPSLKIVAAPANLSGINKGPAAAAIKKIGFEDASMALQPDVLDVLRGIVDPEIGINIVDLGLVYRAERSTDAVDVDMTMTTRACPLGEMILEEVRAAVSQRFPDVNVSVSLVWDPPWTPEMMTLEGRESLAM